MIILSHRGWWIDQSEKNTTIAFRRSFENGFGTETDVRDLCGELVISHDMPGEEAMKLDAFLDLFVSIDPSLPLAINVKSDGIFDLLASSMERYEIINWFAFDMSVPDLVQYKERNIPFFTRQSDIEPSPALLEFADGVWVDQFFEPWLTRSILLAHLSVGRQVCLVSPDLHHRENSIPWQEWRGWIADDLSLNDLMLCTDNPDLAADFF